MTSQSESFVICVHCDYFFVLMAHCCLLNLTFNVEMFWERKTVRLCHKLNMCFYKNNSQHIRFAWCGKKIVRSASNVMKCMK